MCTSRPLVLHSRIYSRPNTPPPPSSKRLVAQNRQYDFLDDLVQSIPDPTGGADAGVPGTSNLDAKSNGKGKARAATNSGKPSSESRSPAVPSPVSAPSLPVPSGTDARSPPNATTSSGGVITAGGARGPTIVTYQPTHGSGKGPSNASVILNSPINSATDRAAASSGPILASRGGLFAPPPAAGARAPETAFDDYDEDDDDDDDYDD